jgi:CRISPR-associated protein Cas1
MFIPDKYHFESRSQHPATDIVNALLNYGYGILYGKIEGALIKSGIDPYIGVFHRDDYNRPVLVYDVIELYRVWVDYVVYSLISQNFINDEFYSIKSDGSYWLESLGRRIIIQSLNDYLDELIIINGVSRSRENHIIMYSQNLAQCFKKYM